MPESLLTLLKLLLLALLYLFFARVLYAVWTEVAHANAGPTRPAPPETPSPNQPIPARKWKRSRTPGRLVVITPVEQQGRVYELGAEQTVGRSPGCQVSLDDTYASQVHARIFRGSDGWFVEDLGSTNGTLLNDRKVSAPTALTVGDRLKIGSTELEVN